MSTFLVTVGDDPTYANDASEVRATLAGHTDGLQGADFQDIAVEQIQVIHEGSIAEGAVGLSYRVVDAA